MVQTTSRLPAADHGHLYVVAHPQDDARDEVSSFNPSGGPRRSKFGPLLLTVVVLLLVLVIFAGIGWLRYNAG